MHRDAFVEHIVFATEEDFLLNVNPFKVYTKHYEHQLNLRSHVFQNEYLTSLYKGSQLFHKGVKHYLCGGFITGLFILPPNGNGLSQKAVEFIPPHLLKTNVSSPFKNSEEDKTVVRKILKEKIENISLKEDFQIKTNKNLLYYSVFNKEKKYTELLKFSLSTLLKYKSLDIDILFITDEATKQDILELIKENKEIHFDFFIIETPNCGIEASKQKIKIFEYSKINDYENVLFIDADTLFVRDVKEIFELAQEYNILYTAHNANLSVEMTEHTLYHGLKFYTKEETELIKNNRQMPFNAGQFMFKNSSYMKEHFSNLQWLMENYPGEYFFEQSFMNHYFNSNLMTSSLNFNKKIHLLMNHSNELHDQSVVVIHFIGPALDLEAKIKHIEAYRVLNNIF